MGERLHDKIAIVVGAGSRGPGIGNGKAVAMAFAREGAKVLCVDLVYERAEETVALIRSEGGEAHPFAGDSTRSADCEAMVQQAASKWGGLDILHNNVGIESKGGLMSTSEEEWDRVMAVDVKSMFLAARAAVPFMVERGGGSIICVSSIAACRFIPRAVGALAYGAAKAAINGFVINTAVELGPKGIRINAIAPGQVWTPMVESVGEEVRKQRSAATPLGTEGTGWDVAWGAVYLASDQARWVTGHVLVIDGGLTLTLQ